MNASDNTIIRVDKLEKDVVKLQESDNDVTIAVHTEKIGQLEVKTGELRTDVSNINQMISAIEQSTVKNSMLFERLVDNDERNGRAIEKISNIMDKMGENIASQQSQLDNVVGKVDAIQSKTEKTEEKDTISKTTILWIILGFILAGIGTPLIQSAMNSLLGK